LYFNNRSPISEFIGGAIWIFDFMLTIAVLYFTKKILYIKKIIG